MKRKNVEPGKQQRVERLIFGKHVISSDEEAFFSAEIKYLMNCENMKAYLLIGRLVIGDNILECGRFFGYWPSVKISSEEELSIRKEIEKFLKDNYLKKEIAKGDFQYFSLMMLLKVLGKGEYEREMIECPELYL